jgi:hypothetical protein
MNWKTFIIIILAGTSLVFSVLYFTRKPKTIIVTVSDPEIIAPPDTVYKWKIKLVPSKPDTQYVIIEDSTAQEMTVSEETVIQNTPLGVVASRNLAFAYCPVIGFADSIYLPDGGAAAMERIKKEILSANEPSKTLEKMLIGGIIVETCILGGILLIN